MMDWIGKGKWENAYGDVTPVGLGAICGWKGTANADGGAEI
jgi:hypothetical protein